MADFKPEDLKPIDVEGFNLEQMEEFEELTGMQFEAALTLPILTDAKGNPLRDEKNRPVRASMPPVKVLVVLLYLANRDHIEGLTLDDVKKIKPSEIEFSTEDTNPKDSNDEN